MADSLEDRRLRRRLSTSAVASTVSTPAWTPPPTPRPGRLLVVVLVGVATIVLWNLLPPRTLADVRKSAIQLRAKAFQPVCSTLEDSLDGHWTPRSPPFTSLDDFALGDEIHNPELQNCLAPSIDPLDPLHTARALAVSNWVWTPYACAMRAWDSEAFVHALLKMPHGMFLVGDSLSGQQKDFIRSLVGVGNDSLLVQDRTREAPKSWATPRGSALFFVNPTHPFAAKLLAERSFSSARLTRPVVTRIAQYHLVSNALLAQFINDAGGTSTVGRDPVRYDYGSDPSWIPQIKAAIEAYDVSEVEDEANERGMDEGTERTVLILNSGVHWTTSKLESTTPLTASIIVSAFERIINYIAVRLHSIPSSKNRLRVIARTIPPMMATCVGFTKPLEPPEQVVPSEHINSRDYPAFDQAFRDNPLYPEILDMRPLVGTRPDGRRFPPPDCIHVCGFLSRSWTEVLWNVL